MVTKSGNAATKKAAPKPANVLTIDRREGGVALVWFDDPEDVVNKLSTKVLGEFNAAMDEVEGDASIKAVVWISRKPDCFIAGADIAEIKTFASAAEAEKISRMGHAGFARIANSKKIHIAAIRGAALGGGTEFALACHYRIATDTPKTMFGLPEVKLGVLPGGGGTQRLPHVVGLEAALDLMLTGKNVFAKKALKMRLVHEVVSPWGLEETAVKAAMRLVKDGIPEGKAESDWKEKIKQDVGPARNLILKTALEMVERKTYGNYPAPGHIIRAVRAGLETPGEKGYAAEAKLFGELVVTPQSRQLVNLFFAMTSKKKHPLTAKARPVRHLGVLGAGLMGSGIALVSSEQAESTVWVKDIGNDALAGSQKYVFRARDEKFRKRAINRRVRDQVVARVHGVLDYAPIGRSDLVIEAVFEDLKVKHQVLREVEAVAGPDCVFASNTSALPIARIAAASKRPENVLGMHYFSPVEKMPLLEVIRTEKTSERALAMAVAFGMKQGKTVIVVRDSPGFYTTRILAPYMNETCLLLAEGATIPDLDKAMLAWGFPVGPAALFDEVGIDVAAHVAGFLGEALAKIHGPVPTSDGMIRLAAAGYKGRKNKKGFYRYDAAPASRLPLGLGKKKRGKLPNEAVYAFFGDRPRKAMSAAEIQDRLGLVMVNEAASCLQEQVIESPMDGDLGAIMGLGFPPFRGGPFRYVDEVGAAKIVEKLQRLADAHGAQFAPAKILVENAKKGRTFYS
ncbi:MAG: enoyl-CoA hydratase/isomerase family protein [Deltaproteobacteria bacterium]|nr:enoyl-CoA hydratase/isomerase family protein [Deltaproteobacteria bacterium]